MTEVEEVIEHEIGVFVLIVAEDKNWQGLGSCGMVGSLIGGL